MGAYLSDGFSSQAARQAEITAEGETMFATDSFMNAEVTYREGRVRRDWGGHRELAAARRAAKSAERADAR